MLHTLDCQYEKGKNALAPLTRHGLELELDARQRRPVGRELLVVVGDRDGRAGAALGEAVALC